MKISVAELRRRAARLHGRLVGCDLCPRRCGVDRLSGERGFCGAAEPILLSAAVAHFGEEPPISGVRGAGNLFLGGCNLRCSYCQNHQISSLALAIPTLSTSDAAGCMLRLRDEGVHNIGWVTPTHLIPQLMQAWAIAWDRGLRLPLVYNCGGYEDEQVLRCLDGVVDVYLPDLKYADEESAAGLSAAPDYWPVAKRALDEMLRQCGSLQLDEAGLAIRGVIVRHLVLPNELAGSEEILRHLAGCHPRPALSLLAQFHPEESCTHPLLQRGVSAGEYDRVLRWADAFGPFEGWVQALESRSHYRPDFTRARPFEAD